MGAIAASPGRMGGGSDGGTADGQGIRSSQGARASSPRERLRRKILGLIEENLCDPDLGANTLAEATGVSGRHVQILLAEMATTPSECIRQKRLDLAARRLELEGVACSITHLAYGIGFNDLSTFCRAFRRRYNVTASEYRAGLRCPKPTERLFRSSGTCRSAQ